MAYVPTTFVDRSVEFPNRRTLTAVSGQADTFDVARAEGTVFAEGTKPDAANLNAEFGHVKTELDAINNNLNVVRTISTEEKIVGLYHDGKPIYKKTFIYNSAISANAFQTIATISNINRLVKVYGDCVSVGTVKLCIPHVHANNSNVYSIGVALDGNNLQILTGTSRTIDAGAVVTIEYTKNTD